MGNSIRTQHIKKSLEQLGFIISKSLDDTLEVEHHNLDYNTIYIVVTNTDEGPEDEEELAYYVKNTPILIKVSYNSVNHDIQCEWSNLKPLIDLIMSFK